MHPAASIIMFTTLSGLGYGLAGWLGLGVLEPVRWSTLAAYGIALMLIGAGLLASTLHLGNPQRAWRAFSQWRSSWLSREGVLAVLGFPVIAAHGWFTFSSGERWPLLGLLVVLLCASTVYCTAMIYASLRSVQAWNSWLTPACYLAFAAAGGGLLAIPFLAGQGTVRGPILLAAALLLLSAWGLKILWWRRMDAEPARSTAASATGLGAIGKVTLFEPPHMNGNYLTHEMGFQVARKHARKLRLIAITLGAILPMLMLLLASVGGIAALVASLAGVLSFYAGIVTERWLFFAEARHAVVSYYGR